MSVRSSQLVPMLVRGAFGLLNAVTTLAPLAVWPAVAVADTVYVTSDTITLAALLPALAGSELGDLAIARSPLPGEESVVNGAEVKAKIRLSGQDARGLAIPRTTRVSRRAQTLSESELKSRVSTILSSSLAPCTVESVSAFAPLTLADGDFELSADAIPRRSSGRSAFTLTLRQGEHTQRLHGQVELHCPPPAVQPGSTVRLVVISGAVKVSALATAHQPGQPGDEIRVSSQLNHQNFRARVIDASTVELVR